ncbi:MAG: hypothetical protein COW27_02385 [Nitrosopumilales archaeon CG15_BIG_FIL_POST_REV_8_21_14_020_37_12]|nr:MAG: hypothetical protein COW27_02385 [Nitrosopumilales archaeon CG15_BIG_FIL_POST_REV_8_21_14_020_37_12]
MATTKQIHAAKQNIRKAQKAWQNMTTRQRSLRQPDGRSRKKPGMGNQGEYYRVIIRPKSEFVTFRTHDVGCSGHTQRVAGKRSSGSWATHSWLIHKDDAYVQNDVLKSNNSKIKQILDRLRGTIKRYKGNIFKAKPRKNIPESDKPTPVQQRARKKNIQKAQRANQS